MWSVLKLVDVCDDRGAIWDTKGKVIPVQYWTGPEGRRKLWHRGEHSWLNFRGRWGNKGQDDCWWHRLIGICQVGRPRLSAQMLTSNLACRRPAWTQSLVRPSASREAVCLLRCRSADQFVKCIISPIAARFSTFSFYLSERIVRFADNKDITIVKVEQTCGRRRQLGEDDGGDGHDHHDDDADTMDYVHDESAARGVALGVQLFLTMVAGHAPFKLVSTFLGQLFTKVDEDLEVWTISGVTDFKGYQQHSVSRSAIDFGED